jgi:hypothetical protein
LGQGMLKTKIFFLPRNWKASFLEKEDFYDKSSC